MRLYRITEDDLAEIERILPDIFERTAFAEASIRNSAGAKSDDNKLNVQIRRVQTILLNVRWSYQPFTSIETLPGGDAPVHGD